MSRMKKKRQYTRNLYQVRMGKGYLRVNYIYNKSKGILEDVIQLETLNQNGDYHTMNMRPDEAVIIAGGLNFVTGLKMAGMLGGSGYWATSK